MSSNLYHLVLAALVTGTVYSLRKHAQQRRRLAASAKVKPEAVQTWEDEGGALPYTGSHMGPNPSHH